MLLGACIALGGYLAPIDGQAQSETGGAATKQSRADFLRSHHWDNETERWVPNTGTMGAAKPPSGVKTPEEVKAERDKFLDTNTFDTSCDCWRPVSSATVRSTLTREQRKQDTEAFARTHRWDNLSDSWVENPERKKNQTGTP